MWQHKIFQRRIPTLTRSLHKCVKFISHLHRTSDIVATPDTVRSSGGSSMSSFTHVSAMDDDQLRTPHASVSQSQVHPSPGSSITLTPVSSKDISNPVSPQTGGPSSVPLPPLTLAEESNDQFSPHERITAAQQQPMVGPGPLPVTSPPTPPQTRNLAAAGPNFSAAAATHSHDFLTSSPASHKPDNFQPPKSDSSAEGAPADQSYQSGAASDTQRKSLKSTGSSSSASLEVSEILESAGKPGQEIPYEDEHEEGQEEEEGGDSGREQYGAEQHRECDTVAEDMKKEDEAAELLEWKERQTMEYENAEVLYTAYILCS